MSTFYGFKELEVLAALTQSLKCWSIFCPIISDMAEQTLLAMINDKVTVYIN